VGPVGGADEAVGPAGVVLETVEEAPEPQLRVPGPRERPPRAHQPQGRLGGGGSEGWPTAPTTSLPPRCQYHVTVKEREVTIKRAQTIERTSGATDEALRGHKNEYITVFPVTDRKTPFRKTSGGQKKTNPDRTVKRKTERFRKMMGGISTLGRG